MLVEKIEGKVDVIPQAVRLCLFLHNVALIYISF